MKKCPGCGAIVQDEDNCGVCGTSLWETRSASLEELVKEQQQSGEPSKNQDHWKRKALLPTVIFFSLSMILIISGFLLLLYSPPVFRGFNPAVGGVILLIIGFIVLLYIVIGPGPSERALGLPKYQP